MSEVDEVRANAIKPVPAPAPVPARSGRVRRVPLMGLLWLALALGYLLASVNGYRALALGTIGLMIGAIIATSGHRLIGVITGAGLAIACIRWADSMLFLAYAPPLVMFAFTAIFFLRTLRPGADPLITQVARREHPELPPGVAAYTRTLTWIWAWCFAGLLLIAVVLIPLVSLEQWSRSMHALGYAVPALLFIAEYAYRHWHFPQRDHGSLVGLVVNIIAVVHATALGSAASVADTQSGETPQ